MNTDSALLSRVEEARRELLDLSLRNPLLNYRSGRARGVEMVGESASQVFDTLVTKGQAMSFLAGLTSDHVADSDHSLLEREEFGHTPASSSNRADRRLQTSESFDNLKKRLLNTYRLANSTIEETGVNTLFIALGMVRWYEADQSSQPRRAPLILVPVRLERRGVRDAFSVLHSGEDIGVNLSLVEKVRTDFGLGLPSQVELDHDGDGVIDVDDYIALIADRVNQSGLDRWQVDPDSVVLGFFSYNKLLMYLDLDDEAWPNDHGIADNEILKSLFVEGFSEDASLISDDDHIDTHLSPRDMYHVLDADSSQSLAIYDAAQGRNMVIQGPPGTGKSQTISNIIAEAVGRGKRVLFVAEKMAALEVVKRRLDQIRLGSLCLELHSHKSNKRETLNDLERTLNVEEPTLTAVDRGLDDLSRTRDQLNDYTIALNTRFASSEVTPHDAMGHLLCADFSGSNPISSNRKMSAWSDVEFERKREVVEELRTRLSRTGIPDQHLFWGCRLQVMLPTEQASLGETIKSTTNSVSELLELSMSLASEFTVESPTSLSELLALRENASVAAFAPELKGLDLTTPEWHSHASQIQQLIQAGRDWCQLRRDTVRSSMQAVESLEQSAGALADSLGFSRPKDVAEAEDLLGAGQCIDEMPNLDGLDLEASQWNTHSDEIMELLIKGERWQHIRAEHSHILEQAWDADLQRTRHVLDTVGRSRIGRLLLPSYRKAKKEFNSLVQGRVSYSLDRQLAVIDAICEEQRLRVDIDADYAKARVALGSGWNGRDTDWASLSTPVVWWLSLLEQAEAGVVRQGSVQLLRILKPRPGRASLGRITQGLARDLQAYKEWFEKLCCLLDAADIEQTSKDNGSNWIAFTEQRRQLEHLARWAGIPPESLQDAANAPKARRNTRAKSIGPDELVDRFNGQFVDASKVFGTYWDGHATDWDAAIPLVEWWASLLTSYHGSHVSYVVRSLQDKPSDMHWRDRLSLLLERLNPSLEGYKLNIAQLQKTMDLDNQAHFGNVEGLASLPLNEQQRHLEQWSTHLPYIQDIVGLNAGVQLALAEGLSWITRVAEKHPEAGHSLTRWFECAWFQSILESAFAERPALNEADGQVQEARIDRFKKLDRHSLDHNLARVKAMHWEGSAKLHDLPQRLIRLRSDLDPDDLDERELQQQLRLVRSEIAKKSRHKPLRQLIQQAGEVLQQIKPVFMMSPLSIAAYLTPGNIRFDLVVFDEASQVRPADALGALLRADKAVVVGDSCQLPPTRFFDRALQSDDVDDYDDDDSVAGMESILRLFNARGAPSKRLRWHYRSRHESLIAVSNREFYDNNLVVFPSPDSGRAATGLRFHHLADATFDRGRSATNQREAEAVARAVMEHAASSPDLSLGVAAFSSSQSNAIEDRLEVLRSQDLSCEGFFASHPDEPFFVKNLENVQGDERDVIFISIGYGRDETGVVRMNFGPLNNEGGERRLNVLITRAKQQCHVFTNLRADDINLGRTNAAGVRALKTFLAYAETGIMPVDSRRPNARVVDSPFQRAVATSLRNRGYDVHDEVASAGYFVDMAIVDPDRPGRYILGIECDGASYHSARSARDRDRLREQVLRGLGWELHRVWSTDWFRNPERELQRTVDAIEQAKQHAATSSLTLPSD